MFNVGGAITAKETEKFVNRAGERDRCREDLDTNRVVNIYGQRRIGKNSLFNIALSDLQRAHAGAPTQVFQIHLPVSGVTRSVILREIASAVAQKLNRQLPANLTFSGLYQATKDLMNTDMLKSSTVVLLLNDLQPLPSASGLSFLLKNFGDDSDLQRIKFAIISKVKYHEKPSMVDESKTYIGDSFVKLIPFSKAETLVFIERYRRLLLKRYATRRFVFEPSFLDSIYEWTAGVPYLLHLIGHSIVNEWARKDTTYLRRNSSGLSPVSWTVQYATRSSSSTRFRGVSRYQPASESCTTARYARRFFPATPLRLHQAASPSAELSNS